MLVLGHADTSLNLSEIPDTRNCTATFTQNAGYALQVLRELKPGLAVLDVGRGTASDLSLVEEAAKQGARVVVIGQDERGLFAQQARARGASAYLENPVRTEHLWATLRGPAHEEQSTRLDPETEPSDSRHPRNTEADEPEASAWDLVLSDSPTMRSIAEQIRRVAPTSAAVLVTGDSGTGKEVVARAIHEQSNRRDKPFLPVNCGAISPQLIESELFGHDKGSFTGAVKDHQGVFERAHGGTLFLDEITEMPLELQVKLLRVLETHEFVRVGSSRAQQADVRVVCASNRMPEQEVEAGNLRADLLYRIQVFPIRLPPLREREGDIPLLAARFLEELNAEADCNTQLAPEALRVLEDYHWPGNLRELRNVIQRAHIMADGTIRIDDLPAEIREPASTHGESGPSLTVNIGTSVAEMEKNLILATLKETGGRKDRAAQVLGVSLKTLYNRLRDYEREDA
ncbi:sigma-54-dependent Fis family transcriptional regulator [Marinobacter nanhaiticus D15-8W]|uniref:Sigma-54-dependent Fis family transcriptional regulator n=2 Tax=Marinobacter TaxID=2742 RepID=N6X5Y7_9GAMM|nr:sigma-54-dependent Fis family transcriptional regulator [Marinobacter nanhaiticus D15-8W]